MDNLDNYIILNGQKVLLSDSQISELRAALEKSEKKELVKVSPFERQSYGSNYYCINSMGKVNVFSELNSDCDSIRHDYANYCTDEELLKQRALEEILARRLWRYSMEHDGDKCDWGRSNAKYSIYYDHEDEAFYITQNLISQTLNASYFSTEKAALNAIKEIIEPFMKEYPDFKSYRP